MNQTSKAWICLVCGYVHHGETPPETCPVCGAPDTDFEAHHTTGPQKESPARQFRCVICGYNHKGAAPPDTCPVCGAPSDDFEPVAEEAASDKSGIRSDKASRIVIVGGGIAGVSAAEHARETAPNAEITLYSKEQEIPYYRLNLTRYMAGEVEEDALPVHEKAWYDEHDISLELGVEANEINPEAHTLAISGKGEIAYDKLVLACGAHPFVPPIAGADKPGVFAVRTRADADALLAKIKPGVNCVCIGGGILGLETAGALARRGASVTVLEGFDYLLPRQLTAAGARVLERHVVDLGIAVRTGANTSKITGENEVETVMLESGDTLPADVVTITTGVRANTHLARRAGLQVNNGIVVDSRLATSHPDIYAAGDVAEWGGMVYGLWEPAHYQGVIAGKNAAGDAVEFGGLPRMNTLKVLGIHLFSIGMITPEDGSYVEIAAEKENAYYRFLFHDNKIAGAILIGDTKAAAAVAKAIKERVDLASVLDAHPTAEEIAASFL